MLLAAGSAASNVGITPVSTAFYIAATLAESFAMRPLPGATQAAAVCAVFQLVIMAGLRTGIRRERAQRTREHVERLYERSAAAPGSMPCSCVPRLRRSACAWLARCTTCWPTPSAWS